MLFRSRMDTTLPPQPATPLNAPRSPTRSSHLRRASSRTTPSPPPPRTPPTTSTSRLSTSEVPPPPPHPSSIDSLKAIPPATTRDSNRSTSGSNPFRLVLPFLAPPPTPLFAVPLAPNHPPSLALDSSTRCDAMLRPRTTRSSCSNQLRRARRQRCSRRSDGAKERWTRGPATGR